MEDRASYDERNTDESKTDSKEIDRRLTDKEQNRTCLGEEEGQVLKQTPMVADWRSPLGIDPENSRTLMRHRRKEDQLGSNAACQQ